MSIQKPKGLITVDEAKKLSENLTRQKEDPNSKLFQMDSNRSFWWSLKDLQQYILYAREECNKKGESINGLRFYIGAYGPEKNNTTTMFMVPTCEKRHGFVKEQEGSEIQDPPNASRISPLNGGVGGIPPGVAYP